MGSPEPQAEIVGDWLAIYMLETQDGYPIVSELRLLPCPPELRDRPVVEHNGQRETIPPHGPELRDVLDGTIKPGSPPPGGITGRLLRKLVPSAAQAQRQEVLSLLPEHLARDRSYNPAGQPRRPGRRGRDDRFYAELAHEYVAACNRESRHPVKDVAGAHPGFTDEYVRDVIHDARERGLLTRAPPGKPGGQLTQDAIDVLEVNR